MRDGFFYILGWESIYSISRVYYLICYSHLLVMPRSENSWILEVGMEMRMKMRIKIRIKMSFRYIYSK